MKEKCRRCGKEGYLKVGWTMASYCSELCERSAVSDLHASMPGAGGVPSHNWVPSHISSQINSRWADA